MRTLDKETIDMKLAELELEFEEIEDEETQEAEELAEEIQELQDLMVECEDMFPDWNYGEQLIHEDDFEEYARDLAEDIFSADFNIWPFNLIPWDHAAEQLMVDYGEIEFEGETYLGRM